MPYGAMWSWSPALACCAKKNLTSFTAKVKQKSCYKIFILCICQIVQSIEPIIGFVAKNTEEFQQVLNLGY